MFYEFIALKRTHQCGGSEDGGKPPAVMQCIASWHVLLACRAHLKQIRGFARADSGKAVPTSEPILACSIDIGAGNANVPARWIMQCPSVSVYGRSIASHIIAPIAAHPLMLLIVHQRHRDDNTQPGEINFDNINE